MSTCADEPEGGVAEAELAAGRERYYRVSFDHAPIGQALVGLDGRWLTVNPALCRLLGRDADTLLAMGFQELTHPDDLDTSLTLLRQVVDQQLSSYSMGKRYLRPDGTTVWADLHVAVVRDGAGVPHYLVAQVEDVSERRQVERDLRQLSSELQWANDALQGAIEKAQEGESLYKALVDHLPDAAVYVYDEDHRIVMATGIGIAKRGFVAEELIGLATDEVMVLEDAKVVNQMIDAALAGRPVSVERWMETTERESLLDVVAIEPARAGAPHHALAIARDISDRKAKERALAAAEARYAALVEHSSDLTCITDLDGRILYASPAFAAITGRPHEDALGAVMADLAHPDDRDRIRASRRVLTQQPGAMTTFQCRLLHTDGGIRHIEVVATNRLDDPAVGGIVSNARDMTERVEAAERIAHQAMHDPLTDLPNRALFLDRLDQALVRARREVSSCAVLFLDLDRFKGINDSLGHAAGDRVLVAAAERLNEALRPGDTVARLGGDEFVVLAERVPTGDVAFEIAERLRAAVIAPIDLGDQPVTVGCSVGIALSDRHRPEALVQEADIALYRAKERGRNRTELYDEGMQTQARARLESEQLIRSALEAGTVAVRYQPIVDLSTGRVTGVEALARLSSPSGQVIGAAEFIPVAEDTGLVVPLGAAVLRQACAQQAAWVAAGRAPTSMSVNVSARQLLSSRLVDLVADTLAEHALPARYLCLELTESALIDASPAMRRNIDELKALGVTLALDDFGTGWSSLAYLRRFPIDVLKIDRSFVTGLGTEDDDTELVRAIISMGQALRMTTIAEGVEELHHERLLVELGCDKAQGYRYGRPCEANEMMLDDLDPPVGLEGAAQPSQAAG